MQYKFVRQIYYFKEYYLQFFEKLKPEVKQKFNWTLQLIATQEKIPEKFFKHLENSNGIFEIRVEVGTDIYRVFCFFDKGKLIILQNGLQKKKPENTKERTRISRKIKK